MEVKIIDYDDLGNGIAKIDNKVCFVKRALPLEVLNIKIVQNKKKYSKANIVSIIEASPRRIKPICKFYEKCGGCQFLHVTKEEEINFKIKKCKNFFGKCDKFYQTLLINYRDKVTLHVKRGEIGFYDEKTNDLVSIASCHLLLEEINEVIKVLKKYKDEAFNGSVVIRENSNKEIMLIIEGNYKYIEDLKREEFITNIIYNKKVLKGNSYFIETILDYKFKVSYDSFFQVNLVGLLKIYEILSDFFKDKLINTALDLYSGTSVLGIFMAKYVKKVVSIEVNKSASLDALENVRENKIHNLEIINGKVEDHIDEFQNIDLIVVDPARRGLDSKTIAYFLQLKPKYLIYIACGMDSLKRDLEKLKEIYELKNLFAVDMFPRTNHVECVCVLNRR